MPQQVTLALPVAAHPEELPEPELRAAAASKLGLKPADVHTARVRRISLDARPRHMAWQVVLDVWAGSELPPAEPALAPPAIPPPAADAPHVVVVGLGPAGMFCALDLLRAGLRVTLLERGKPVQERRRDIAALQRGEPVNPDSNYCFGEGGAGAYSDGKLYCRSGTRAEIRAVLEALVAHGAPKEILVSWRPHVGSNRLPEVVQAFRETLVRGGAALRFETRATALETADGADGASRVTGVRTAAGDVVQADAVVLAAGHSALDTLFMARTSGAALEPKGFAVGIRVEHPQSWLDAHQYHGAKQFADLPPAFYELAGEVGGTGVYSFCMCPGGWIVPTMTSPGLLVVNGMSLAKRDSPYANSGLVVALAPEDWCGARGGRWGWPDLLRRAAAVSDAPLLHEVVRPPGGGPAIDVAAGRLPESPQHDPLFGLRIQLALEVLAAHAGGGGNRAPAQRVDHFVQGRGETGGLLPTSYHPGLTPCDLGQLLPPGLVVRLRTAIQDFEHRIPGFAGPQGQLVGVETRTSSAVRITRDPGRLESPTLAGLYPCGEGAGYAGGIVSAALDGRRVAAAVRRKLVLGAAAAE